MNFPAPGAGRAALRQIGGKYQRDLNFCCLELLVSQKRLIGVRAHYLLRTSASINQPGIPPATTGTAAMNSVTKLLGAGAFGVLVAASTLVGSSSAAPRFD